MKHIDKNFVDGRGAVKVRVELNAPDFSITYTSPYIYNLASKSRGMLINYCKKVEPDISALHRSSEKEKTLEINKVSGTFASDCEV